MLFYKTLAVYILGWVAVIIYSYVDADNDYKKIKTQGGIKDHTPEVIDRLPVFLIPMLLLLILAPSWLFALAWLELAMATYWLVFEDEMNDNLQKSFLYTGRTSKIDKFFYKLPKGAVIKVLLKGLFFAIGIYFSLVLFINF